VDHVGAGRDHHPDRSRTGDLPQGDYSVSDPPRLSFIIRRAWLYGLRLAGWTRTRVLAQPEPRRTGADPEPPRRRGSSLASVHRALRDLSRLRRSFRDQTLSLRPSYRPTVAEPKLKATSAKGRGCRFTSHSPPGPCKAARRRIWAHATAAHGNRIMRRTTDLTQWHPPWRNHSQL
jgi:hypothetical protein